MSIIDRPPREKKRFFRGHPATIAFELDPNQGIAWCDTCLKFHAYSRMAVHDVSTRCPKTPDGVKTTILVCGLAPFAIRRAVWLGRLDPEAKAVLNAMSNVLDILISSEKVPS